MKAALALVAALSADLGEITSGHIRNPGNTAALRLSGTTALPATNFIDFTATGASPFIKHPGCELLANGNATFAAVKISGQGSACTLTNIDAFWTGSTTAIGTALGGMVTLGRIGSGTGTAGRQVTVSFPTAYTTAPYIVIAPKHTGSMGGASSFHLGLVTTTGFAIHLTTAPTTTADDALSFMWVVVG